MTDDMTRPCFNCNGGVLRPYVDKEPTEYKSQAAVVDLHHSVCDVCGIDVANGEQINLNTRNMIVFRKGVDGFLSGAEIRAIREGLGLSQEEAEQAFESGGILFSDIEKDERSHSARTEKLLRQAAEHPEAFMQARDRLAAPTPLPTGHVLPERPTSPAPMPG